MIVCAGEIEQFSFATPIGIGITKAAINTTKIILQNRPKSILFAGTAGSYGNADIFDLLLSNSAKNIEISALEGKSYTPIDLNVTTVIPPIVSRETFPSVCVNSSHYISIDSSTCKDFLSKNCEIENMEFYGFLSAAYEYKIKAFGLFCVTNYCNSHAHSDFINNHNRAKEILTQTIENNFKVFI